MGNKCANCQKEIPLRYLLVEILCGMVSYLLFPDILTYHTLSLYLFYFNIFVVFLCLMVIDFIHQILPDVLNIYLGLLFFIYAFIFLSWKSSLVGLLIGLLVPLLVTWAYYFLRGKIGLGGGDIKLFAILGIYLGPLGIIHNIFASCLLGSVIGGLLIFLKKMDPQRPIPFGPFIIAVAIFQIFSPHQSELLFSLFR